MVPRAKSVRKICPFAMAAGNAASNAMSKPLYKLLLLLDGIP
jgi:hypothetical protein